MRLKKGFTLAEILIVLMVIGVIATMTIPSLMRGVTESQWKTAYKKAYNTIANLTAMERIAGQLPSTADKTGVLKMFQSLNSNLSVKDYAAFDKAADGSTIATKDYSSVVSYTDTSGVKINDGAEDAVAYGADDTQSPWIISEDNIAYSVIAGTECGTKQDIIAQAKTPEKKSCAIVIVDVNGLSSGPNKLEPQISKPTSGDSNQSDTTTATGGLDSEAQMATLTGDRYYIYIGYDGATAGSKKSTVTGRIAADLK